MQTSYTIARFPFENVSNMTYVVVEITTPTLEAIQPFLVPGHLTVWITADDGKTSLSLSLSFRLSSLSLLPPLCS